MRLLPRCAHGAGGEGRCNARRNRGSRADCGGGSRRRHARPCVTGAAPVRAAPGRGTGIEERADVRQESGNCQIISALTDFASAGSPPGLTTAAITGSTIRRGLVRLLALPHARAMIDMPIGLKWSGYRICDLRARELVGAAVFLGARRDLWKFADMAAANRHYWECKGKGKGVSAQLWNIRDKIR